MCEINCYRLLNWNPSAHPPACSSLDRARIAVMSLRAELEACGIASTRPGNGMRTPRLAACPPPFSALTRIAPVSVSVRTLDMLHQ